jgi:hypothetical protein
MLGALQHPVSRGARASALIALGVGGALLLAGCGGFREAYDSRVCWSDGVPVHCSRVQVAFGCSRDLATFVRPGGDATVGLSVRVTPPEATLVGALFHQTQPDVPIEVAGPQPAERLRLDAQRLLARAGHPDADEADHVLELYDLYFDVRSEDPGWLSLRVTTRAQASFSAALRAGHGEALWSDSFSGAREVRAAYAALSDSELALSEAYCAALEDFAEAIVSPGFARAAGR